MDTEKILVKKILDGDSECFTGLVNRFYPGIVAFIYKMNASREDAEDLAQEVFIKAFNNLYKYNDRWSFSTWLFNIAVNTYKDFRKRKRLPIRDIDETEVASEYTTEGYIENIHQHELIKEMFNSLNEDVRAIMILRYYQGLTFKEIGQICRISPEAVKMKISRARNKLCRNYGSEILGGEYYEM